MSEEIHDHDPVGVAAGGVLDSVMNDDDLNRLLDGGSQTTTGTTALVHRALKLNLEYQRELRAKLRQLDTIQEEIKDKINMVKAAEGFRQGSGLVQASVVKLPREAVFGAINAPTAADGGTSTSGSGTRVMIGLKQIIGADGSQPTPNPDVEWFQKTQEVMPLTYTVRSWSEKEKTALARGVWQQNMQIRSNRVLEEFQRRRGGGEDLSELHEEIQRLRELPEQHLQMNTGGVNWQQVASSYVPSRSAADCRCQWLQLEDPRINKQEWSKNEDKLLLSIVRILHEHGWEQIAKQLGTNRTPAQCFQRYQRSLNRDFISNSWTSQQDEQLFNAVELYGTKKWNQIAQMVDGKTGSLCMSRHKNNLLPNIRKGKWDKYEDLKLVMAVHAAGQKWSLVSQLMDTRLDTQLMDFRPATALNWIKTIPRLIITQCRERWLNVLNKRVIRGPFTDEEDSLLRFGVAVYGPGVWTKLLKMFPGRTDNQLWRRWQRIDRDGIMEYRKKILKKRSAMISSFVGRKQDRPDLTPDDFDFVDGTAEYRLFFADKEEIDVSENNDQQKETVEEPTNIDGVTDAVEEESGKKKKRKIIARTRVVMRAPVVPVNPIDAASDDVILRINGAKNQARILGSIADKISTLSRALHNIGEWRTELYNEYMSIGVELWPQLQFPDPTPIFNQVPPPQIYERIPSSSITRPILPLLFRLLNPIHLKGLHGRLHAIRNLVEEGERASAEMELGGEMDLGGGVGSERGGEEEQGIVVTTAGPAPPVTVCSFPEMPKWTADPICVVHYNALSQFFRGLFADQMLEILRDEMSIIGHCYSEIPPPPRDPPRRTMLARGRGRPRKVVSQSEKKRPRTPDQIRELIRQREVLASAAQEIQRGQTSNGQPSRVLLPRPGPIPDNWPNLIAVPSVGQDIQFPSFDAVMYSNDTLQPQPPRDTESESEEPPSQRRRLDSTDV